MQITRDKLQNLTELLEDSTGYFCDENTVSGETTWTVLQALAEAKLAELNGQLIKNYD